MPTGVSAFDAVLLGLLLLSVALGAWRGLVFEVLSLAGWVLAWWLAGRQAEATGQWLGVGEAGSVWRTAVGYTVSFVVVLLACALLARLVRALIAITPLTVPDRLLGALFGFLRGAVLLLVLVTVVGWSPLTAQPWWRQSRVVSWVQTLRTAVQPWLPASLQVARAPRSSLSLTSLERILPCAASSA